MKSLKMTLVALFALLSLSVFAGCAKVPEQAPAPNDSMMQKTESSTMIKPDESKSMQKPETAMEKSGSYKDYSTATVAAEQAAGNKVVLFFHAPWCPYCKAADSAFTARIKEIPAGVVVLKTDYDSNTELKKKYGVTYQHTFVQIDNDQNKVTVWNGGDVDNLITYLK